MENNYHIPVLLQESLTAFEDFPTGIYVDATFGGGGHSKELLKKLNSQSRLIAFDKDEAVLNHLLKDERFLFFNQDFRYVKNFLKIEKLLPIQGIIADLGVSSHQFDTPERGFSTRARAAVLDMRMQQKTGISAQDILTSYSEKKLIDLFWHYGELTNAKKIVEKILLFREKQALQTVEDLQNCLEGLYPAVKKAQFFARVFQALRIEVNQELQALESLLLALPDILAIGGKAVIISYHSLEDRLVKNMFKTGNLQGILHKDFYGNPLVPFTLWNKKPIIPSEIEIQNNPRSRSAKMRVAVKK